MGKWVELLGINESVEILFLMLSPGRRAGCVDLAKANFEKTGYGSICEEIERVLLKSNREDLILRPDDEKWIDKNAIEKDIGFYMSLKNFMSYAFFEDLPTDIPEYGYLGWDNEFYGR